MKKSIIDREIEKEYYQQSEGTQIEITKIVELFQYCRNEISNGVSPHDAVGRAIGLFCVNA